MLTQNSFYFATIRRLVLGFGSIFNNIKIVRFSDVGNKGNKLRTITVPISYGGKHKWYRIQKEDRRTDETKVKVSFPRMSFEITNMQYDANRQLNRFTQKSIEKVTDPEQFITQLKPVPYDISFDLHIGVKNINDGLQIVEQILPYFTPSLNLPLKTIDTFDHVDDVPIIFSGIQYNDEFEGSFEDTRILTWTLSFVAKAQLYPPLNGDSDVGKKVIKKVLTGIYRDKLMTEPTKTLITVSVDPLTANVDDIYNIEEVIEDIT